MLAAVLFILALLVISFLASMDYDEPDQTERVIARLQQAKLEPKGSSKVPPVSLF